MKVFVQTDVGRVRPINEDSYYLPREGERFCAIADGMGGHNAGEIASAMAVRVFSGEMRMCRWIDGASMRRAVERANSAVHARSRCVEQYSGMGTTFTALALGNGSAYIAHVGDSRIYRLRGGRLEQITQDHSLVEELVRARIITREEARTHPRRNIITRALGTQGDNAPDLLAADRKTGDLWLLCTDGLTGMVSDGDIARTLKETDDLDAAADSLLAQALDAGGRDNVTLILWRDEEG